MVTVFRNYTEGVHYVKLDPKSAMELVLAAVTSTERRSKIADSDLEGHRLGVLRQELRIDPPLALAPG